MKRIDGSQAAPQVPAEGGVPATPVTSNQLAEISEDLHKIREQLELIAALLGEIGK